MSACEAASFATEQEELDHLLCVLRATEGVREVIVYPKDRFDTKEINNNGVKCRIFNAAGDDLLLGIVGRALHHRGLAGHDMRFDGYALRQRLRK